MYNSFQILVNKIQNVSKGKKIFTQIDTVFVFNTIVEIDKNGTNANILRIKRGI